MTQNAAHHDVAEAPDSADVCIPNIGPKERAKRLRIGVIGLSVGALVAVSLLLAGADRAWRLMAFLPFWAGATSIWQVRERTCVALAQRGVRNLDAGEATVSDAGELRQIARQARRVKLEGFATAVLVTLALLALP